MCKDLSCITKKLHFIILLNVFKPFKSFLQKPPLSSSQVNPSPVYPLLFTVRLSDLRLASCPLFICWLACGLHALGPRCKPGKKIFSALFVFSDQGSCRQAHGQDGERLFGCQTGKRSRHPYQFSSLNQLLV